MLSQTKPLETHFDLLRHALFTLQEIKTRMLENIFLKIYKYMYDYIKTMDSIYCVLTPVSWVRTVNRFIFYYKHCIKLSYANFPLLLVLINIKLSAKLCPKSPEFKPGYI